MAPRRTYRVLRASSPTAPGRSSSRTRASIWVTFPRRPRIRSIHITTRGFMGRLWRSASAARSSSSIVFITSITWIMSTSDRATASAAAFTEGAAFMEGAAFTEGRASFEEAGSTEGAAFTEAAGGTVSPWLHTRGSPLAPAPADAGYIKEGVLRRVLPPDLSEAKLGHARAAWTEIVGAEYLWCRRQSG